ncbi:FAD-dependent oxidoreductase [Nannocystaceae bacterium ST9]
MTEPAIISTFSRAATIDRMASESFDLIVIGGGITGAGLARDAALRGLSVALVDAADFASGTSSRSSKLIHGGLRYLERGEINLVRKTASERKEIHRLAPHLTEPRWMVMPLAGRTMLYSIRLAVTTYERLGGVAARDTQQTWSGSTLAENEPLIDRKAFPFALAYREYITDDARLVLANMRSAVAAGAAVLNHARVVGFVRQGNLAGGIEVRCVLSEREFVIRGKVIVNAAGPWVEALQKLENREALPFLHLSKGIHVSLPASKLPIRNLMVLNTVDKRRIFALRRDEVVYLGTTDTTYEHGPDLWPATTMADVEYLLEPIPRHFSSPALTPDDVIATWAGLRPLIADPNKKNPSELSRRDELLVGPLGVISVAGGKLTGYRAMARRVLGSVAEQLGRDLPELALTDEPLLPGGDFPEGFELPELAAELERESVASGRTIDRPTADRLARLYGTEARAVLAQGHRPIHPGARAVDGEVRWAVEREGAATLEDVFYRRMRLAWFELEPRVAVEPLAARMAECMNWDDATRAAQVAQVEARLSSDLNFVR